MRRWPRVAADGRRAAKHSSVTGPVTTIHTMQAPPNTGQAPPNDGRGSAAGPAADELDISALLDPSAFPHPISQLRLRETPISWVLLTGLYAYKIKKSVRYDFLDASTLERRRFLCDEELRLNRRFAPEIYLDVVPIAREHGQLRFGAPGAPVEFAVRMRQFDPDSELASQLAQGRVGVAELADFGRRLAGLHRSAPSAADTEPTLGSPDLIRSQLQENFAPVRRCLGEAEDLRRLAALAAWLQGALQQLQPLLEQRRRSGRVRECHGDLHSGNIVRWHGQWQPFDCIEFEPRLRWIDVISDVAFLYMDLRSRGADDLAHGFLSAYLEEGGDYEGLRLLSLYSVYRALVRAKVDALGIPPAPPAMAQELHSHLLARLQTAVRLSVRRRPALILMHGVSASGKSWLSEQLIAALPAIRVRSDLERRRLQPAAAPRAPEPRVGEGAYDAATTQRTYARLLDCAASALQGGQHAIIDATFLQRARRQQFEALARGRHCACFIVSCHAARATLERRLALRAQRADDPSEATAAVLQSQLDALEPLGELERARTVEIDTGSPAAVAAGIRSLRRRLLEAGAAPLTGD